MDEANLVLDYIKVLVWPLLLIALALVAAWLFSTRTPNHAQHTPLRADLPRARSEDTMRLTAALEDSEWLASLYASPPPDPAVHLQQAVRINPVSYREAARQIRDSLHDGRLVILDFAGADEELAARLIDFCSATTLATRGLLQQISSTVLLVTPHSA
ncbi:FtsZ-interacting cell division protein YlmF [Kutzneria viridogrisea]|uniref:FtsZ-interacting cell division protein YlmF n=1 Tax=Kutzneria viridogrisea TaxID=47990 RepID=A0ABR6BKU7_9PSEU|nr:FtsZ-interacting cell division protein YlmF [Kutzneria viridogrisea]